MGENEIHVAGIIFNNVKIDDPLENQILKKEVAAFVKNEPWKEIYRFLNNIQ